MRFLGGIVVVVVVVCGVWDDIESVNYLDRNVQIEWCCCHAIAQSAAQ